MPADAPIRRNLTGAAVELQRPVDVAPRPADVQPPPADSMPRSGMSPPSTRRRRTPARRREPHLLGRSLNLTRTRGSFRFSNECPICCAPARPRSAKLRVPPCRSGRRRVNSGKSAALDYASLHRAEPAFRTHFRMPKARRHMVEKALSERLATNARPRNARHPGCSRLGPTLYEVGDLICALSPVSASNRAPASWPRRSAPRSSGARPARGPARRPDCRSPPG